MAGVTPSFSRRFARVQLRTDLAQSPASPSLGESLQMKEIYKKENAAFEKVLQATKEKCASPALTASIDWSTFKLEEIEHYSAATFCNAALEALQDVCGKQEGKEAVQAKVKNLSCKFGSKRDLSLGVGSLAYTMVWGYGPDKHYLYENLMKLL